MQIWGEKRETLQEWNDDVLGFFFLPHYSPPSPPPSFLKDRKQYLEHGITDFVGCLHFRESHCKSTALQKHLSNH